MQKVISSLIAACKAVSYVKKSGRNPLGYSYASESDVISKVRGSLLDNDLVLVPSVGACAFDPNLGIAEVHVDYRLIHSSGEVLEFKIIGQGMDRNKHGVGDKGIYKAITGANKYALLKLLQLATGDDPEDEIGDYVNQKNENSVDVKEKNDSVVQSAKLLREFIAECKSVETLEKFYKDNQKVFKELREADNQLYTEIIAEFTNHKKGLS